MPLMENRSGILVDACRTRVSGHAKRIAALAMIEACLVDLLVGQTGGEREQRLAGQASAPTPRAMPRTCALAM
jgi:hypothetical protein